MHDEDHLNRPGSLNDALSQLVKSIAIEEEALATLMKAEADKTLAFVGKERELPTQPSSLEFIQFNQTVSKVLDSILMAEWMLMKKIESVMQFQHLTPTSGLNITSKNKAGYPSPFENEQQVHIYNESDDIDY
ncbi:hypothetical protein [Cohnella abietis]|uniref:Uncharacterized protein n=1 Tax=Cohnella abietis TaxID=2507935 RepID=A0A3T1D3M4_9BACL|nr:hypothetical protein [Cohnella abietis]BBI32694.1 hypothetical protein KCTCHS21_20930 [Cohnella abietis]